MLCYEALAAVSDKKRVTIVQLDSGNGKSFLLLLTALYLTKTLKKDVVISTLNGTLLSQLKQKSVSLKLQNVKFIRTDGLGPHLGT
jgi:Rad3-related DNA helicase